MTSNSTGDDANDQDHRHAARSAASTVVGKRRRATALRWSLVGFAVLVLVGVVAGLWLAGRTNATDAAIIGTAPHYRLVNQNGKPVSSQDLAGKVQIVTALFPYCTEFCPLVAANLVEFRDNVVRNSDMKGHVVFVFFNVAPADAGPAALRTFLKQYGWDPADPAVEYLTGSPKEIRRVVQGGYHIAYYRTQGKADNEEARFEIKNPLAQRVKPNFDVVHGATIEIVDGKGRIRKIFSDGTRLDDRRLQSAVESVLTTTSS